MKKMYPELDWTTFSQNLANGELCDEMGQAERIEKGEQHRSFKSDSVSRNEDYQVSISRDFLCLNHRELLSVLPNRPARVPAKLLNKLPTMKVPREDPVQLGEDETEDGYLFLDPAKPFRRVSIQTKYSIAKKTKKLERGRHFRKAQASMLKARMVRKQQQSGLGEAVVLGKLKHHSLLTVQQWASHGEDHDESNDGSKGAPAAAALVASPSMKVPVPRFSSPGSSGAAATIEVRPAAKPSPSPSPSRGATPPGTRADSRGPPSVDEDMAESTACGLESSAGDAELLEQGGPDFSRRPNPIVSGLHLIGNGPRPLGSGPHPLRNVPHVICSGPPLPGSGTRLQVAQLIGSVYAQGLLMQATHIV